MARPKKVTPETEERHHASYVPRWSVAERDRRWALIRERMVVEGIDCLLMVGTDVKFGFGLANVRYVSHIGSVAGVYVLFPLVGEPVIWTERPHQFFPTSRYLFTQDWVTDIRPDNGPKPIVDFLKEKRLDRSTIGLVGYGGTVLAGMDIIPATFTEYIYKELPYANFVRATGLINHVRVIKSAEEISFLEKAASLARKMIDKAIESAEPGKKECEVFADMVHTEIANGGEAQIFIPMSSGPVEGPGNLKQLQGSLESEGMLQDAMKQLEDIMKLMQQYRIDQVELGGMKVTKSYHEFPQTPQPTQPEETDEDILFYSAT